MNCTTPSVGSKPRFEKAAKSATPEPRQPLLVVVCGKVYRSALWNAALSPSLLQLGLSSSSSLACLSVPPLSQSQLRRVRSQWCLWGSSRCKCWVFQRYMVERARLRRGRLASPVRRGRRGGGWWCRGWCGFWSRNGCRSRFSGVGWGWGWRSVWCPRVRGLGGEQGRGRWCEVGCLARVGVFGRLSGLGSRVGSVWWRHWGVRSGVCGGAYSGNVGMDPCCRFCFVWFGFGFGFGIIWFGVCMTGGPDIGSLVNLFEHLFLTVSLFSSLERKPQLSKQWCCCPTVTHNGSNQKDTFKPTFLCYGYRISIARTESLAVIKYWRMLEIWAKNKYEAWVVVK